MTQAELFEPTGLEVGILAEAHAAKAEAVRKRAAVCEARGWVAIARMRAQEARDHADQAEALAMLADLERLAGIT